MTEIQQVSRGAWGLGEGGRAREETIPKRNKSRVKGKGKRGWRMEGRAFQAGHGCRKGGPDYTVHALGIAPDALQDLNDHVRVVYEPNGGEFGFYLRIEARGCVDSVSVAHRLIIPLFL